jgi:flagellar hook-associated protein 1 FlgK
MSSLNGALSIASGALSASQTELTVASNNIANVSTAGYARETATLKESTPVLYNNISMPTGVTVTGITSLRDTVLEMRLNQETQQSSKDSTLSTNLSTVESMFTETSGSIGTEVDSYFTALSSLAVTPTDSTLRQNVLTAAQNVASAVNTAYTNLSNEQSTLNANVSTSVSKINDLTSQIAAINVQVSDAEKTGNENSTLSAQRSSLISQLSNYIDVSEVQSDDGLTLTTSSGAPLVVGSTSYALTTASNSSGGTDVYSQGTDITSKITGGSLGGTIETRDTAVQGLMNDLNTFAYSFTNAVNTAQSAGYESDGTAGSSNTIFTALSSTAGAASAMSVSMTDGSKLAASSTTDGTDGGNLDTMAAVKSQAFTVDSTSMTYGNFYSNFSEKVGELSSSASSDATASAAIVTELTDQVGSVEGVSLDDEATSLIRYQQSYEAAARVINIIAEMGNTLMQMGT